ncbi:MAG: hypothetical protein JXQ96_08975 [Cyclobacteriaceae bacterium]
MMKSQQFFKLVIVVLVLLNLSVIAVFFIQSSNKTPLRPMQHNGPGGAHKGPLVDHIEQTLQLDEGQKEKYKALRQAHMKAMKEMNDRHNSLLKEYFQTLKKEGNKTAQNQQILSDIQDVEKDKVEVTYEHFRKIKALCSEEQLEKFPKVMDETIRHLLGTGQRRRPPPPMH